MAKEGDRGWTIDGFQAPDRGQESEAIQIAQINITRIEYRLSIR